MIAEYVLRNLDRLSESPAQISDLRRFILELAIRGRLSEASTEDEPVTVLLRRMEASKEKVVEELGRRLQPNPKTTAEIRGPFAIPSHWRWVRLDTLGVVVGGATPRSDDPGNFAEPGRGVPWLTPADLGGYFGLYVERGARDLTEQGIRSSSVTVMPPGTVLFTSRAPIGYVAIASNPICTNQGFKSIVPYLRECCRFVALVLRAFAREVDAAAPGTTFKEVSGKLVAAIPFPLPPLNEQHRIVTRVDELMALCDQLEVASQRREIASDRLADVTFGAIERPCEPQRLQHATRFAIQHVRHILSRRRHVGRFRASIINLAITGRLVSQQRGGVTARELLEQISAERAELERAGLIRRLKPLPTFCSSEVPFPLPDGWIWSRLGDAVLFTQYGTSQKAEVSDNGVPVFTMGNIQRGAVISGREKRVPATCADLPELFLQNEDLLYNRTNSAELVGKTGIYLGPNDVATFASYLIRIRASRIFGSPRFLNLVMNSTLFRESQIVPLIKKQTGQANVNGTALRQMLIPVAPPAEQNLIVSRVTELMEICDELESRLDDSSKARDRFVNALIQTTVGPFDEDALLR